MLQSPAPFFPEDFPPLFAGNTRVTLYSLSKASEASKAFPFLPLNPFISRVVPEENSCPKCWSVSSLFRNRLKTSRPQSSLLHLATFGRMRICPFPHLGHGCPLPAIGADGWKALLPLPAGIGHDGTHESFRCQLVLLDLQEGFLPTAGQCASATLISLTAS